MFVGRGSTGLQASLERDIVAFIKCANVRQVVSSFCEAVFLIKARQTFLMRAFNGARDREAKFIKDKLQNKDRLRGQSPRRKPHKLSACYATSNCRYQRTGAETLLLT